MGPGFRNKAASDEQQQRRGGALLVEAAEDQSSAHAPAVPDRHSTDDGIGQPPAGVALDMNGDKGRARSDKQVRQSGTSRDSHAQQRRPRGGGTLTSVMIQLHKDSKGSQQGGKPGQGHRQLQRTLQALFDDDEDDGGEEVVVDDEALNGDDVLTGSQRSESIAEPVAGGVVAATSLGPANLVCPSAEALPLSAHGSTASSGRAEGDGRTQQLQGGEGGASTERVQTGAADTAASAAACTTNVVVRADAGRLPPAQSESPMAAPNTLVAPAGGAGASCAVRGSVTSERLHGILAYLDEVSQQVRVQWCVLAKRQA